jgi:membrane associated rhomboid family serine protease
LFPLKDNLPTSRFPVLTVLLIAVNVAFFIWQTQFPTDPELERAGLTTGIDRSAVEFGAIPYRVTHPGESGCSLRKSRRATEIVCGPGQPRGRDEPLDQAAWWVTVFTSLFMHGGVLHLAGNMLFLWVFGANIEDSMGRPRFLLFYLLAGVVAVYAQSFVDTSSTVPTIGASGAVAGVLGGYALIYPRARVLTLIFLIFFITLIEIPAMVLLGIWFVLQFLPAIGQTAVTDLAGGDSIAYLAHVGGFIFGLAAIKLFANRRHGRGAGPPDPVY